MLPLPNCPFCHHRNPLGAKFCNECGSPLHLAPCEVCGAVNNLTDTHCWQCDGALRPPKPPVQGDDFERDPGTSGPALAEPEHPFTASERDYGPLEQKLTPPEFPVPALDQAPKADDPQPRRVERTSRDSSIPESKSLFVQAEDAPRKRRHGLIAAAFVLAVASAIAVGAYLHLRDGRSPETVASPASPSGTRADASAEPRAAPEVAAVPATTLAPTARPEPEDRDAPMEPPVASDADRAPAPTARPESEDRDAPVGPPVASDADKARAAAPAQNCPPPVEAMALCEWLVHPGEQR